MGLYASTNIAWYVHCVSMRIALAAAAATLLAALTACSAGTDPEPAATTATKAAPAPEPVVPHLDEFTAALAKIDPALKPDKVIDDAQNTCLDIRQGKTEQQITTNTAARFGVDPAEAAQIVSAVRDTICKP